MTKLSRTRWALIVLLMFGCLGLRDHRLAFSQREAAAPPKAGLYPQAMRLAPEASDQQWQAALRAVDIVRELVEGAVERNPLSEPAKLPTLKTYAALPLPIPGSHSMWREAKYVSHRPPNTETGSYIYGTLAVINGPLIDVMPEGLESPRRLRDRGQMWSGYIYSTIAVVHGGIKLDGYVKDSLVIAAGPIKIDGYINNSIVISLAAEGDTPIDVEDGYVADSLLVARQANVGSFRSSTIIGKLISDDLRGGEIVADHGLLAKLIEICQPVADARRAPASPSKAHFQGPSPSELLDQLLHAEQDAEATFLADLLAAFQLTDAQVRQLVAAAEETASDTRRNTLWHALRMSKSRLGRQYLLDRFVRDAQPADNELIVHFLHTLTNPSTYDAQLLMTLYQHAGKTSDHSDAASQSTGLLDLEQQVVHVATTPWQHLCTDWNRYGRVVFTLDKEESSWNSRRISDRRREQAERGQFLVLLWLVEHGRLEEHRQKAYQLAMNRGEWVKFGVDVPSRLKLVDALVNSSNDPEFRASIVPLVADYRKPETFLDPEEHELVRLAAVRALDDELEEARRAGGYHHRTQLIKAIVAKLSDEDPSPKVRQAADELWQNISK